MSQKQSTYEEERLGLAPGYGAFTPWPIALGPRPHRKPCRTHPIERNFLPYGQKMKKAEEEKEPQFSPQIWIHPPEDLTGGPTSSRGNTEFHVKAQPLSWDQIHTEALIVCGQVIGYGDASKHLHLGFISPSDIWVVKGQKGWNRLISYLKL